jgi:hypothetical protein
MEHHDMKTCEGVTSALDGGNWPASHSGRFTPGERGPGNNWTGDQVGARPGVDPAEWKRNISCPWRESNFGRPARSSSLYHLSYAGSTFISRVRVERDHVSQNKNNKARNEFQRQQKHRRSDEAEIKFN